jgi:phage replication O-like protein O
LAHGGGNPQLEDGFARIANEILEAIARTYLSDYESRCIHFLWRKTYGWHSKGNPKAKKTDAISLSQWQQGTCIERRNVARALNELVKRNIVTKTVVKPHGRGAVILYSFQKHYKEWKGYTPPEMSSVETPLVMSSPQTPFTKEIVSKQTTATHEMVSPGAEMSSIQTPEMSSIQTPTIDNIDKTIDNSIGPILKVLQSIKKYPYDEKKDTGHLENLAQDFPQVDLLKVAKALRDYCVDKPLTGKSSPRLRLRNFCEQEVKYMETHPKETGKKAAAGQLDLPDTATLEKSWGKKFE